MVEFSNLSRALDAGELDQTLRTLGCITPDGDVSPARARILEAARGWMETFGDRERPLAVLSAPGRTELGGNHTDHQHGCVLAGAVTLDILACVSPNQENIVRFQSQGWPMVEVDLSSLEVQAKEKETTEALVRGIAARIAQLGYQPGGFDAYTTSNVLPGSGLSSSAACEVLLGVIWNHLYCGDRLNPVEIAQIGQYAENVYFGKPSGLMDQMASSVGGAVSIDFADPAAPVIRPVAVDLAAQGYGLCIVDSGADHADLTAEYASIPKEMGEIAAFFGKKVLRQVEESEVMAQLPALRKAAGDRAVLRAMHFFQENRRAIEEAEALERGEFERFLSLVEESGRSSWMYLQNIAPTGSVSQQAIAVALMAAREALGDAGACRIHGGGFAGTIQVFVPLGMLEDFCSRMESALGKGCCHVLSIRPVGGAVVWPLEA